MDRHLTTSHAHLAFAWIGLLTILGLPASSPAVTRVPVERGLKVRAITRADTVYVLRLRPEPIPYCEWDAPDSLRFTLCHEVAAGFPAPDAGWCRDLADLLAHAEMGPWDRRCDYIPQAIVRFVEEDRTSDLVVLTGKCDPSRLGLVLIVSGSATEYGELRGQLEDFRDMMAYALEPDEEVRDGSPDRDASGQDPPFLMPNVDNPPEGDFVYYEEAAEPVTRVEPAYPEFAKEAQIQGKVILHVLVGRDGRVKNIKVIHGVTGLNEAAADAVKKWVFRPALSNGKPVAVWVEVPMDFNLDRAHHH